MGENRLQHAALFKRFGEHARQRGARHRTGEVCRASGIPEIGAESQGCGGESKFDLPATGAFAKDGPAVICAVCDQGYKMPRYGG